MAVTLGARSPRAGIFKKSMGARNRGGIGLSYRPARLHRLAEFIPWNQFRGPIRLKIRAQDTYAMCLSKTAAIAPTIYFLENGIFCPNPLHIAFP